MKGIIRGAMHDDASVYGIDCKNQSSGEHTFQIPPPRLFDTNTSQQAKATDIPSVNLLCPQCKLVFGYSARDIHPRLWRIEDQHLCRIPPACFLVEFLCGTQSCEAPLRVHVFAYGHTDRRIVLAQLKEATFHVPCPSLEGHYPRFDPKKLVNIELTGPFAPF